MVLCKNFPFFVFVTSAVISVVYAQVPAQFLLSNPCPSKTTCRDCIQTSECAWCNAPRYKGPTRCFQPSLPMLPACPEEYTYNPDNVVSIWRQEALTPFVGRGSATGSFEGGASGSGGSASAGGEGGSWAEGGSRRVVQVSPQKMNVRMRVRQKVTINMAYTQAEDYPVDLYYLMDLSRSMLDDKQKLEMLGDRLARTMQNITTKFKLGYGSFVDKVVMPYISTVPERLQNPCQDPADVCVPPYGYRHHMTLSENTFMFTESVRQARVSGNLDAPEGGFDAIMQAVVCRNEIGWRERARRLLVYSTDASFHCAGDGRLGGIIPPNDGYCHMSSEGYYSMSSHQDYPSIEQINLAVQKNSINVIFAVTGANMNVYKELSKKIEGSSAARLKNDSSNIIEIIKEEYQKITSTVTMRHNASSDLSVRFFTRCNNATGPLVDTNKCGNIKLGNIIEFKVELELLQCPENPNDRFRTIQIYPVGLNESLSVDVEMLCECECEKPGDKYYEENSPYCHGHGTYKCGICFCSPGAFGKHCECNKDNLPKLPTTNCIHPNSTNDLECWGRGTCTCGVCECEPRINLEEHVYGDYCECDNFSCERYDGQICGGAEHGICECGHCVCKPGWSGPDCSCKDSNDLCYPPDGGKICSGHGSCICGSCQCEPGFSGIYCNKCPTCPDRCEEFKACVECKQYNTGPYAQNDTCEQNCYHVPVLEPVETVEVKEENSEFMCRYTDEDNCEYKYVYYYDDDRKLHIRVQEKRKCPPEIFVLGIVFGVIAAVVLVGMAILLMWKLFATISDRREFAKFEKERMMARWDTGENPIYKQATSTFKNPTYRGNRCN